MRRAQLIVCEPDSRLTELLRPCAQTAGWWLRELHHPAACLGLLQGGPGAVLVLKLGRDLEKELSVLEQATRLYPETPAVVVGDAVNAVLEGLAWDLGASYVLFPPQPREQLPEIVAGLMGRVDAPAVE